ncbi:hypothetical protein [Bacillus wiedmannii]|uniref:hypothetical protein n=1 Tax=Bacillus wiedmannii TaxID=1890302 RepID=UPI000BF0588E|nr:hypothetical protein [Bacillus wiedmannii]PEK58132.1 hypothetical protein CN595_23725 [Bacillus wiedmannii]
MELSDIEKMEAKYLKKYYHFLKFAEDELLYGFKTKEATKDDWYDKYKSGISDFAVGAERIVYSMLNGKGIGQPNSCPVGSDLFFEVHDAYIHIDLKTVGTTLKARKADKKLGVQAWSDNIGDFISTIFVGTNQNSYTGKMIVNEGKDNEEIRDYVPSLPTFYNKGKENEKICLTYFITILYDKDTLDTLVMCIVCMPNGELEQHYKERVLSAGKNIEKTRFKFSNVTNFELLDPQEKRIKVVYYKKDMDMKYQNKLKYFKDIYEK